MRFKKHEIDFIDDKPPVVRSLKFCVAGYRGKIGSYILNGLIKYLPTAVNIYCFDKLESEKDKIKRIKDSDVIFNCVSFKNTIEFLESYKQYLKGKTVIDQSSWKSDVFKWNLKNPEVKIIYMHILFDPSRTPVEDRCVLTFPHINIHNKATQEVLRIKFDLSKFITMALDSKVEYVEYPRINSKGIGEQIEPVTIDLMRRIIKDHDTIMAYQQPMLYDMVTKFLDKYKEISCGISFMTRNMKHLYDLLYRINSMSPELKEMLYKNPYYRRLK